MTFLRRLPGTLAFLAGSFVAFLMLGPELQYTLSGRRLGWFFVAVYLVAFLAGLWSALWVATGRNPLGARRPEDRDRVPRRLVLARVALGYAVLGSLYMILSLPIPTSDTNELRSLIYLGSIGSASVVAMLTLSRRSPFGRWLTMAVGAWAFVRLALGVVRMWGVAHPDTGVAIIWSLMLAGSVFVMLIVAALVVLTIWRDWPPRTEDMGTP